MKINCCDYENNNSELFESQAHVWNYIFTFINSMSLKCAIELGIPDVIHAHDKPITISELNAALPIHPTKSHFIPRLLRILIHSGFVARAKTNKNDSDLEEEDGYILTNSSRLLLEDNPYSVRPFLLATLDPVLTKPWHHAATWFQNHDSTPFETAHGMPFWDCCSHNPKLNTFFNKAMASDARLITSFFIDQGRDGVFNGSNSIVDVGGGTGTVAKAIAEAFPEIQCTVLDLPHVVAGLHSTTPNLEFVAGNMFEAIPAADAILLKWILHDWSDEECLNILKQCKKAIEKRKGGKVIIIDMVRNNEGDDKATETQLFFDMLMMVLVTGKERNEKEWANLFCDSGFSAYKIISSLGLRSIIEVYP